MPITHRIPIRMPFRDQDSNHLTLIYRTRPFIAKFTNRPRTVYTQLPNRYRTNQAPGTGPAQGPIQTHSQQLSLKHWLKQAIPSF